MPRGYLRILYPAPEVCLDLQAWQEFYGFDLESQEGWFDIDVDTENYIITVSAAEEMPFRYPRGTGKLPEIEDPDRVEAVRNYVGMPDRFMNNWTSERSVPGPFGVLTNGMKRNIDPRKLKR